MFMNDVFEISRRRLNVIEIFSSLRHLLWTSPFETICSSINSFTIKFLSFHLYKVVNWKEFHFYRCTFLFGPVFIVHLSESNLLNLSLLMRKSLNFTQFYYLSLFFILQSTNSKFADDKKRENKEFFMN